MGVRRFAETGSKHSTQNLWFWYHNESYLFSYAITISITCINRGLAELRIRKRRGLKNWDLIKKVVGDHDRS